MNSNSITTCDKIGNLQEKLLQYIEEQKYHKEDIKINSILQKHNITREEEILNITNKEELSYVQSRIQKTMLYIPSKDMVFRDINLNSNTAVNITTFLDTSKEEQSAHILEPKQHYQQNIDISKSKLKSNLQLITETREKIYKETKKRGVKRTNDFYNSQKPYTKKMALSQLKNYDNENIGTIIKLLKKVSPEDSQRAVKLLTVGKEEMVSLLIGKKLSKQASTALKALTYLVYREHNLGNTECLSTKIKVKASDLWQLCNIKKTPTGYDHKSKEKIKRAIKEELKADIFYEDKKEFLVTSFLLKFKLEENNKSIIVQIDDMFLVNKDDKNLSYYYSDLEGCNRLMNVTKSSEEAYWLHHYLEHALKSNIQFFNFHVLLEQAGLVDRYKIAKTRIKKLLFSFLDAMVSVRTLIDKWDLVPSDTDEVGKFKLENLRTWEKITMVVTPTKKRRKCKK